MEQKRTIADGGNIAGAREIGRLIAERARAKGHHAAWCSTAAAIATTAG